MSLSLSKIFKGLVAAGFIGLLTVVSPLQAVASTVTPNSAKVSFTFDDGLTSALTEAAPVLAKYGYTGTEYVTTSCIGSVNTCDADPAASYMKWNQVVTLKNTYGWEIGAHMRTHTQTSSLSATQLNRQITQSNQAFVNNGIPTPTAFASPEGDYSPTSLATLAKYYTSHRGFHDTGYNQWPYNDYILRVQQVQAGVSVAQVKSYIDYAKANNVWLILVFHDIQDNANPDPQEYEYSTGDLDQIAAYVKAQNVPVSKISEGLVTSSNNLIGNSSFDSGLTGWTNDDATKVTVDTASNGSYPSAKNSARLVAGTKNVHFFSPTVNVNPNDSYVIKKFIKLTKRTTGDVSFYIDEYNANGTWISGQYKGSINWAYPEERAYSYTPSSGSVTKARLQITVLANSGITAFVDNVQLFSSTGGVVVPPPAPTNLLPNGTFDAGISSGWRTDKPASVLADNTSNGSTANPVNSVKFVGTNSNIHLFSPNTTVESTKTYAVDSFVKVTQITSGELGFYIDEYDANGNWISGQWKAAVYAAGSTTPSFNYTPSSVNVKLASLQVYATANSGITAYFDDVHWYAQ